VAPISTPSNTHFLGPTASQTATASRSVHPFLHSARKRPHTLQWAVPFPLQNYPSTRGPGPHLTHGSLGPPKSTPQTASRSVQPFLQGSRLSQTDREDRQTHSICSNRPHICSTATQSKITLAQNMLPYPHKEMTLLNQLPKNTFLSPLVPENNLWAELDTQFFHIGTTWSGKCYQCFSESSIPLHSNAVLTA